MPTTSETLPVEATVHPGVRGRHRAAPQGLAVAALRVVTRAAAPRAVGDRRTVHVLVTADASNESDGKTEDGESTGRQHERRLEDDGRSLSTRGVHDRHQLHGPPGRGGIGMTLGDQLDGSETSDVAALPHQPPPGWQETSGYSVVPPPAAGAGMPASGSDFDTFYAASFRRVVAALAPVVGSFAEAEDLSQEAFTAAAERWDRISAYEDPEGWVRRVAYNKAISVLRSAQRRTRAFARQPDPTPTAPDELEVLELFDALRKLPMKYRTVLTLHYLVDLPVKQIAEELDMPFLTVRSHLARGRRRLQELLADADGRDDRRREAT